MFIHSPFLSRDLLFLAVIDLFFLMLICIIYVCDKTFIDRIDIFSLIIIFKCFVKEDILLVKARGIII